MSAVEAPWMCTECFKREAAEGRWVCAECDERALARRRGLVDVWCDLCGEHSEVWYTRVDRWVCSCRKPQTPARKKAQQFNRDAKRSHPSGWADGVASPKEAANIRRFLAGRSELIASLLSDSSRIRARCSNYSTTVAWWLIALARQDGRCAICGHQPDTPLDLSIDHDHQSGRVRGLLCTGCNVGLGHLGVDGTGDLDRARSILSYVEAFRAS